jgi:beta-phosphoglucomutase
VSGPAAFILDFNGTISDDEPLLAEIYGELFAEIGLELSPARYQDEFAGLSDPAIVARGIALAGRTDEAGLAERLVAGYTSRYLERVRAEPPIGPDAEAFLRAAAARVPLAIASGAPRVTVEAVLAAAGLRDLFTAIVTSEDVTRGKPDPEPYLVALRELEELADGGPLDAATVWVVEDASVGVLSARAAGMPVVALRTEAYDPDVAPADLVVERLDAALVEHLFSRGRRGHRV